MEEIQLPIEVSEASPLKPDFKRLGKMIIILIGILISSYIILIIISSLLVKSISIEEEINLFEGFFETQQKFDTQLLMNGFETKYNIYVIDDLEANAYALPGGIIYLTEGLLDELKYEEELIFIIGHEIAHIENRDILKKISKELPFGFVLASLGLDAGFSGISISSLSGNYSSQNTEINADNGGIDLINSMSLNLECALGFFERSLSQDNEFIQFLSTHPSNQSRIESISKNTKYSKECTEFENKKNENL